MILTGLTWYVNSVIKKSGIVIVKYEAIIRANALNAEYLDIGTIPTGFAYESSESVPAVISYGTKVYATVVLNFMGKLSVFIPTEVYNLGAVDCKLLFNTSYCYCMKK